MGRAVEITERISRIAVRNQQLIGTARDSNAPQPIPIPLEDLDIIVLDPISTIALDTHALRSLMATQTSLVVTDSRHLPAAILLPMNNTNDSAKVVEQQILLSKPNQKRLWQHIVKAKILNQAANLDDGPSRRRLVNLAQSVKSGDIENVEAHAARFYWAALLDKQFKRLPRTRQGTNAALDYCYAIVRATLARAIVGVGLHPGIGIHHSNRTNPFALVDDLMEPFRPLADRLVTSMNLENESLTASERRQLLTVLHSTLTLSERTGLLPEVAERFASNIKRYVLGDSEIPEMPEIQPINE